MNEQDHPDDIELAKELHRARTSLLELSNQFYKATGVAYEDVVKSEKNYLSFLATARIKRQALKKLTPEERDAIKM